MLTKDCKDFSSLLSHGLELFVHHNRPPPATFIVRTSHASGNRSSFLQLMTFNVVVTIYNLASEGTMVYRVDVLEVIVSHANKQALP